MDIYSWLIERILDGSINAADELQRSKIKACKLIDVGTVIPNSEIIKAARERIGDEEELNRIIGLLKRKITRTISGVAPVAVMTSPADCPHGRCICCPGGVTTNTPQSYTGHEPAALRGAMNDYDPYLQTVNRIKQLEAIGHSTAKIDLIVMGGTFPARDRDYQERFIMRCFEGMNRAGTEQEETYKKKMTGSLEAVQKENETAPHRCIGLTIETRPDHCYQRHVDEMLELGATRVELGVQSLRDEALIGMERGHDVEAVVRATDALKNRGLKVCYHIMPGLPGETPASDLTAFDLLYNDPRFRPDMLKIYPVVVVAGTELYDMWKRGDYEPYDLPEITSLLSRMKERVPTYARIQRIQRDIPAKLIASGVKYSNLRQIVRKRMEKDGKKCRCIRCREAGHNRNRDMEIDMDDISIGIMGYEACGGKEYFVAGIHKRSGLLYGYLRLRSLPENISSTRPEMMGKRTGIIRELKVVGAALDIGKRNPGHIQHMGLGDRLMERAEDTGLENGMEQMLVTSGVGVREYYRKRGYERIGPYMGKTLK